MPFYPFWGEGSPTKIEKDILILTSLLEDLVDILVIELYEKSKSNYPPFKHGS